MAQVLGQASAAIDFLIIHWYPLCNQAYGDYCEDTINFQVRALLCLCSVH